MARGAGAAAAAPPSPMREGTPFTAHKLSRLQRRVKQENEDGKHGKAPKRCVVTGATGFVGQRLVEMLVERGAERVVSFDVVPPADGVLQHKAIEYVVGDLTDAESVKKAIKGADCVWHIGACVGPYHPKPLYTRVNVGGTANVIAAMKLHNVKKLVYACSPSTRFPGDFSDLDGLTEDTMVQIPQQSYTAEYAKTKADGEILVRAAVAADEEFLALACAPHQVYGPRDNLFLPNVLEAAGTGKLRVFGSGKNKVCWTYVDNYCHGLILAERALYKSSPALAKFYVCTDGDTHPFPEGYCLMWDEIDKMAVGVGFNSFKQKTHLPKWLMLMVGYTCDIIGHILGRVFKINAFAVHMMTMHRWFRITNAERDLGYKPIVGFNEGCADTVQWFKKTWLPSYDAAANGFLTSDVAKQTKRKIDIQASSANSTK